MTPQIFAEQLHNGAWGMTAATVNQVQVMHHYGVKRVVLGNQLIGKAHLAGIAALINGDPGVRVLLLPRLRRPARQHARRICATLGLSRPIRALLEIGAKGGRTGLRTQAGSTGAGREARRQ